MSKRYFSTFITGFDQVINDSLKSLLNDVKIELLLDGLVVYSTELPIDRIRQLAFFNNTFLLLKMFDKRERQDMGGMIKQVLVGLNPKSLDSELLKKSRTFRVIASKENQFTSIDNRLLNKIEDKLTHITRLRTNRSLPDVEFWFLARSEGYCFFGMRLTRHRDYAKSLQKGELRPELASILNLLSELNKEDVFLDPFAGLGSIPIARSKQFPYKQIIAYDNDLIIFRKLKDKVKQQRLRIDISCQDAIKLPSLNNESIDKIVTDPPWGHFLGKDLNLVDFYTQMLESFYRVLRHNGLVVLLVGERELFENLLGGLNHKLLLTQKYYTLVSGRKAGVYKLKKI